MKLGQRLKASRNSKGMSQQELTDICGTKRSILRILENDLSHPTLKTLVAPAKALNTTTDYPLGMYEEKEINPVDKSIKEARIKGFCSVLLKAEETEVTKIIGIWKILNSK